MKSSLFLVLGLIFAIVIAGISTLQSNIVLLAFPLMVYLLVSVWQRPEVVELTAIREVQPDYAPDGAPITIRLIISNRGSAIGELAVEDILPARVTKQEGQSSTVRSLPAHGQIELEYTIAAQRGSYDGYEVQVSARDCFNLFEQPTVYRTIPHFVVYPRYPKLDRIRIRPPQTRGFAGPIASRQGGTGIGFWGVREYQIGDSRRQINWRLTARSDQGLYTNLFEQERVADVGLILDARQLSNVVTASDSLFEHSVQAVAAMAASFLGDGNRVSLLIYGSGLIRVFPGYGHLQRDRILRALSRSKPGLNYAMENLANLPTRIFPAKSQIVMVSPLVPEDIPVIIRMRAHGYAVLVISPDPVSFQSALFQDFNSPAYHLASAERVLMVRQILRNDVQIVNWVVDKPLEVAIRDALSRQLPVYRLSI